MAQPPQAAPDTLPEIAGLQGRFVSLAPEAVRTIAAWMPEFNRAVNAFGRQNSQTTAKLMTLTMLNAGPYRMLRQCLAEIERKRQALQEAAFRLRRQEIDLREKRELLEDATGYWRERLQVDVDEIAAGMESSRVYVEGALKDIAAMQTSYDQIKASHNIPDDWDEQDFEAGEIEHHVRQAFTLAVRDLLNHSSVGQGVTEYAQQFGIHPATLAAETHRYLTSLPEMPDVRHLYDWLGQMATKYREAYRLTLAEIGVTTLVTPWHTFQDRSRDAE